MVMATRRIHQYETICGKQDLEIQAISITTNFGVEANILLLTSIYIWKNESSFNLSN